MRRVGKPIHVIRVIVEESEIERRRGIRKGEIRRIM